MPHGARGNGLHSKRAHEGSVTGIAASSDGLSYATAGTDSRVRLWDADTYRCLPYRVLLC